LKKKYSKREFSDCHLPRNKQTHANNIVVHFIVLKKKCSKLFFSQFREKNVENREKRKKQFFEEKKSSLL